MYLIYCKHLITCYISMLYFGVEMIPTKVAARNVHFTSFSYLGAIHTSNGGDGPLWVHYYPDIPDT